MIQLKIKFIFFVLWYPFWMQAQSITIEFPEFAGKTYEFSIFQGDKQVKIYENDTIPQNGIINLVIPKEYAPYTGMCKWLITNTVNGGGLDMAIPGFGYKVTCLSDKPDQSNIKWDGYDGMNELNRLKRIQQAIIEKFETMGKATQLYDKSHPLYATFQQEKATQAIAYEQFQQDLTKNSNYNARLLPIVNLLSGLPPKLTDDYEQKANYVNQYITEELNYDDLYTSGYWPSIIQSWVQLQTQLFNNAERFAKDFNLVSMRIAAPRKYADFVSKVTTYLTQYGKDDFITAITPIVIGSGKITTYEGQTMQVYVTAMVGSQAPALVLPNGKKLKSQDLAQGGYEQILLLFFDTGCGHCEEDIKQMQSRYTDLQAKKIRLMTFAADTDTTAYKKAIASYPWPGNYCDFKSMAGENFKNYAITGAPTLILLDKAGKVLQRAASLSEVERFWKLSKN